jgi:hypothetical protein
MADCPSEECHNSVDGMRRTLYGMDGKSGLVKCLDKFVKTRTVWVFFIVLGLPLIVTGLKVWSGQESDQYRYASKEAISDLDKRISLLEAGMGNISSLLISMNAKLDQNRKELLERINEIK